VQSSTEIVTPTPNILQAGCPSCRPTNSVKALKEKIHSVMSAKLNRQFFVSLLYVLSLLRSHTPLIFATVDVDPGVRSLPQKME